MKEDYPLFTHWYQTLDWILDVSGSFPRKARFTLATHIADNALETLELIIEAIYTRERIPLLDRINLQLEKLRVLFRIAHDRRYIATRQYEHIARALDEAGRMTGGWRKQQLEARR